MPLPLDTAGLSDVGHHRRQNEDRWIALNDDGLFAVADGLGGLPHGAEAAAEAVDSLARWFCARPPSCAADLRSIVQAVNGDVAALGRKLSPLMGIGTTLTVAHPHAGRLWFAHVGDSGLFRVRGTRIEALTREHTVAARAEAQRKFGFAVDVPPGAEHILTSCLGLHALEELDDGDLELLPGDRFVLLTDGISKYLPEAQIAAAVAQAAHAREAVRTLVDLTLEAGAPDNATAVALFVPGV